MKTRTIDQIHDQDEYEQLSLDKRTALQSWIHDVIVPASRRASSTSYGLKHYFEDETGIYVSNGAFKGAMLAAGHKPTDPNAINWTFRIEPRCICTVKRYLANKAYARCSLHQVPIPQEDRVDAANTTP